MPDVEEKKSLLMTNIIHWRKCTSLGMDQGSLREMDLLCNCQSSYKASPLPNPKQYIKCFYSNKMVSERKENTALLSLLRVKLNTTQYSDPYFHLLICLLSKLVPLGVGGDGGGSGCLVI